MFLVRLIYASTISGVLDPSDYQNILASSIKNNSAVGITGMLCCDGRHFLQCLEGSRQAVNRTYARIINDPRHRDVLLLSYGEVASRNFSEWAMSYVALSSGTGADIQADVLLRLTDGAEPTSDSAKPHAVSLTLPSGQFLRYSIKREFDPYVLTDAGSLALLQDLAALFSG
jgi:hypothetical protein